MSVFSDFQRMWVQRFPHSSLSDAWEQDVRASLDRHKQKIAELSKELEQETLYVEYLERLLEDVEKYREIDGDLSKLLDANAESSINLPPGTNLSASAGHVKEVIDSENVNSINKLVACSQTDADTVFSSDDESSVLLKAGTSDISSHQRSLDLTPKSKKSSPLHQCIDEISSNMYSRRCVREQVAVSMNADQTQMNRNTREHLICDNLQQSTHNAPQSNMGVEPALTNHTCLSEPKLLLASPSHFVTVIEVKESKNNSVCSLLHGFIGGDSERFLQDEENPLVTKATKYDNVVINTATRLAESADNLLADDRFPQQYQQYGGDEVISSSTYVDANFPKLPDRSSHGGGGGSSFTSSDCSISKPTSQLLEAISDHRKKIPPRPPPKNVRRAAPVEPPTVPTMDMQCRHRNPIQYLHSHSETTTSTTPHNLDGRNSSLERNIKVLEISHHMSSDWLDLKLSDGDSCIINNSEKIQQPTSLTPVTMFLSTDSPIGSISKVDRGTSLAHSSPNGSLKKVPVNTAERMIKKPTANHGKINIKQLQVPSYLSAYQQRHGSDGYMPQVELMDSLALTGCSSDGSFGTSTRTINPLVDLIKSYESISSLSSDTMRLSSQQSQKDYEHYYDTVPLENRDGDFVNIQPGGKGTGSTSSREDVSTIENINTMLEPLHQCSQNSNQSSLQIEPESSGRSSNYVNIEYFIHSTQNHTNLSSSMDSDSPPVLVRKISTDKYTSKRVTDTEEFPGVSSTNANRDIIIRRIVTSIITSETLYVECLNKMKQYMKAIRATLTTSQPVISEEEFQTIFFKIEDLHEVHSEFLTELKATLVVSHETYSDSEGLCVGEPFRQLAAQIHLYGAFLHNYRRAIDTVKMCGTQSQQFKEIVSNIVFKNLNEQKLSLEELLHKPVARVQKNALVLEDLLIHTPEQHPDYYHLRQASRTIRSFLSEFNVIQTRTMFPSEDKALRRLVKNSFIVELADGHRKLRHLLLFNDVIACAKYKAVGRAGDRNGFEFELKWFIPLRDIVVCEESVNEPKETSTINILHLKSQACTVRDQIMLDEKDRSGGSSRVGDKHRKKLADLEAQLVLASPNLVFKIGNKTTGKTMTFFLSSDFERTQWIESILSLQKSCNLPGQNSVQIYDLHAWITACQALIKTEMGSYLMRNAGDESLLIGDLHLTIQSLSGVDQPCDMFMCVEIDSYGHYFRKAKTKLVCRSATPQWNESFVLELEGSQNMRVLLYQDDVQRPILRAKYILKLSRTWMQETPVKKILHLSEKLSISTIIRFVPGEVALRRVPTSKPGALFGAKLQHVIKREKRDIPFIVSACVREVERRGMTEVGIYRVSGSASDVAKLKKSFETNAYEAEQLLKEVDVHSVTGILKSYLRDLPEALFTDQYYPMFFDAFNRNTNLNESSRLHELQCIFTELPQPNKATINMLLDHLMRVNQQEIENKMSLHNLAMVFGPTLLRPGPSVVKHKNILESSTADVMTQAGILYSFMQTRLK